MKYICLFENFEEGHKFDLLDLFTISPSEVEELFFREIRNNPPDLENIQVFLDSGLVEVNAKDDRGRTPLHSAAGNNHLKLAELLISSGAEVNAKNEDGNTPLHWAAYRDSLEVAKLLISSGADLEAKNIVGWTPLAWAARWNRQKMVELLKKHGGVQ